jgi:hypothetical protein
MQSRCGPPQFDQQDWSQFDFSRWHLDDVTLDAASAAVAGLSEQLFNSDEWRQHFQAMLPGLEKEALGFFKDHSQGLRDQKDADAQDFDKRIAAARTRSDEFRKSIEAAAAPRVVEASPNTYHLVAKVTIKDASIALPGVGVQIMDPRNERTALAEAVTDLDGNAILTLPEEIAKEMDKRDTALEVLVPGGKTLLQMPGAVCMRLNQVETKMIALPDSPDIEAHKNAAAKIQSEREARVSILAARIDTLTRDREGRLHDLDCRLADNEAIIAELETTGGTATHSPAAPARDETPPADPPKKEDVTSPPRPGRKKR